MKSRAILLLIFASVLFHLLVAQIVVLHFNGDAREYDTLGWNLASKGIFSMDGVSPSRLRPPLLPFFLAAGFKVFGHGYLPLQIAQMCFDIAAAVCVYFCTQKLSPKIALASLTLCLFNPFNAAYARAVLSECLTGAFLVFGLTALLVSNAKYKWLLVGFLFGLAALTRDVYLLFPPFVGGWMFFKSKRLMPSALIVLSAFGTILPWSVRNYIATGHIALTKGVMGFALWQGTIQEELIYVNSVEYFGVKEAEPIANLPTEERDDGFRRLAISNIKEHPVTTASRWIRTIPWLFIGPRFPFLVHIPGMSDSNAYQLSRVLVYGANITLVALGLVGIFHALRVRSQLLILLAPVLYTLLIYLPFQKEPRYTQPVFMFILAFAASELVIIFSGRDRHTLLCSCVPDAGKP